MAATLSKTGSETRAPEVREHDTGRVGSIDEMCSATNGAGDKWIDAQAAGTSASERQRKKNRGQDEAIEVPSVQNAASGGAEESWGSADTACRRKVYNQRYVRLRARSSSMRRYCVVAPCSSRADRWRARYV